MMKLLDRLKVESFQFARSHFLDDFYATHDASLAMDSILELDKLTAEQKALLAATVDEVYSMHGLDVPEWVLDPSTYLDHPVFAMNAKGALRLVLIQESPCWYRSRNLFVTENCSSRV